MPLTKVGERTLAAMKAKYGSKKGESVFYAAMSAGTISRAKMEGAPPPNRKKGK